MENLNFQEKAVILEVGCGRGQLTIPFAKKLMYKEIGFRVVAFDISTGPYGGSLNVLMKETREKGLKDVIMMAHGELSPIPENEAQKLTIEADFHSLESLQPKPEWFSPSADEVASLLHRVGFKNIRVKYFETNVRMDFEMAMKTLREWNVDPAFIEKRMDEIGKYGLELPMEHIIFCQK